MHKALFCGLLLAGLSLCLGDLYALDDATKAKAKEVLEKNKDAIISVKAVISMVYSYGMGDGMTQTQKQESKAEVAGTIVDPSGLTLVEDPSNRYGMDDEEEDMDVGGGDKIQLKPKTDINDVKLVLADGTELPAEIVLKDKEMGLSFVRPKEKPAQPLPHVSFGKPAEPGLFDHIITLRRLSRALDRSRCVVSVQENAVQGVIKKPRTFYIAAAAGGTAVFDAKGEALGVGVLRRNPVRDHGSFHDWGEQVVLPAEDVQELIKQALNAKVEEQKPEPKPEEK